MWWKSTHHWVYLASCIWHWNHSHRAALCKRMHRALFPSILPMPHKTHAWLCSSVSRPDHIKLTAAFLSGSVCLLMSHNPPHRGVVQSGSVTQHTGNHRREIKSTKRDSISSWVYAANMTSHWACSPSHTLEVKLYSSSQQLLSDKLGNSLKIKWSLILQVRSFPLIFPSGQTQMAVMGHTIMLIQLCSTITFMCFCKAGNCIVLIGCSRVAMVYDVLIRKWKLNFKFENKKIQKFICVVIGLWGGK